MASEFDPYHKWLGISPREQPPNHYRLLAIDVFEGDKEVIDAAANRQMSYLQELASGPNVKHAQKLLTEISAARVCLLDGAQKKKYDAELGKALGKAEQPIAVADAAPVAVAVAKAPRPAHQSQERVPARPQAASPQKKAAAKPAAPSAAQPIIQVEPRQQSVAQRTSGSRKSTPIVPIVGMLAAAVLVCAIAVGVIISRRGSGPANLESGEDRGGGSSALAHVDAADSSTNPPATDRGQPDRARPNDVELPQPGKDLNPEPAVQPPGLDQPKPKLDVPPKRDDPAPEPIRPTDPQPNTAKPNLYAQAESALQQSNVDLMIKHLETYLADDPQSPWKRQAEDLLSQGKLAISDEAAKKIIRDELNKLTDDEIEAIAQQKKQLALNLSPPVAHPVLKQVFIANVNRHVQAVFKEHVDRRGMPPEEAVAKADEPEIDQPKEVDPEPVASAPRPTDPAELLAAEGLVKSGSRWIVADLEQRVKDELTSVNSMYKELNDLRREIPATQRQRIAIAKKQVTDEEGKIQAKYDQWKQAGIVLKTELDAVRKREAEVRELRQKVEAAEAKVIEVDDKIFALREQLQEAAKKINETVEFVETNYDRLLADADVLAAIESNGGGAFTKPSVLNTAKSRIKRLENDLTEGNE